MLRYFNFEPSFKLPWCRARDLSGNPPVVIRICDLNKSRARHHHCFKLSAKFKYLNIYMALWFILARFYNCSELLQLEGFDFTLKNASTWWSKSLKWKHYNQYFRDQGMHLSVNSQHLPAYFSYFYKGITVWTAKARYEVSKIIIKLL